MGKAFTSYMDSGECGWMYSSESDVEFAPSASRQLEDVNSEHQSYK